MQGNCSASLAGADAAVPVNAPAPAAHSMPVPLKPFQCRLLTDGPLFRFERGSVWMDNLFVAAAPPLVPVDGGGAGGIGGAGPASSDGSSDEAAVAALLSIGPAEGSGGSMGERASGGQRGGDSAAVRLFMTDITVQGDGHSDCRILRSMPVGAPASVLAQGVRCAVLRIML